MGHQRTMKSVKKDAETRETHDRSDRESRPPSVSFLLSEPCGLGRREDVRCSVDVDLSPRSSRPPPRCRPNPADPTLSAEGAPTPRQKEDDPRPGSLCLTFDPKAQRGPSMTLVCGGVEIGRVVGHPREWTTRGLSGRKEK